MKTRILIVALGAGLLPAIAAGQVKFSDRFGAPCEVGFDDCVGCGKAAALRLRAAAGLAVADGAPGFSDREALADTDVLSNDLDIEINPTAETIAGSNTMRVRVVNGPLTQFTFMLRSNYTITSATINAGPAVPVSGPGANSYARRATLDRPYASGEEFTLRIAYSGTAVSRGFGSIEFQTQPGTSNPIVATLSEAYFAGTWWPVKDGDVFLEGDNADKATIRLAVTAPDTLRTVSNGVLESVTDLSGSRRKYQWASNYPTSTYLVAFGSSVYNTWTQTYTYPLPGGGSGSMPVEFNIYPASDTPGNRAAWGQCLTMLATFRPIFGEYPFVNEKYGIYQFPFGGGMEHQTNTGQGTFAESVTAHELGHQWWGDDVTCRTWHDIWLNEGFATYSEALWLERKPGSTGLPALLSAMAARRPSSVGDSVYVYATNDMNRIFSSTYSYRKGAWVLHMLRHVVGDAAFFDILAEHRARHGGGGATTDDFAGVASGVFEAAGGYDLAGYFDQWVYGIGAPAYAYGWQNVTIEGQRYVRLHVRQTQDASWGSGGVFTMPVDVRIDHAGGPTGAVVKNSARTQHFLIPVPQTATGVTLDEFDWILNTAKVSETYQNGPPKVVVASPGVGATIGEGDFTGQVRLTFSEGVNIAPGNASITGPGGSVPFTLSYDAPAWRATLTTGALAPGAYAVTVAGVTAQASGLALDGEVGPGGLPSGDGLPGGSAQFSFTVTPRCVADFNNSGGVPDDADVAAFFAAWNDGEPAADVNESGGTPDDADVAHFFARWNAGC